MAEVPVAFIITEKDSSIDSEFIINAMTEIASFKIPRHTIIVDEFPMTSSGKQESRIKERCYKNSSK